MRRIFFWSCAALLAVRFVFTVAGCRQMAENQRRLDRFALGTEVAVKISPTNHLYSDEECKPVALVPLTMKVDKGVQAILDKVWAEMSRVDRTNFHRFCCENARDEAAMDAVRKFKEKAEKE